MYDMNFVQQSLDSMSQGLSVARMVNGELRVVLCNNQFIEMLDFPAEFANLPRPFSDFIKYNAERGEYGPGDIEQQVEERVQLARKFLAHAFHRTATASFPRIPTSPSATRPRPIAIF
jgi:PAS domain-containing protein